MTLVTVKPPLKIWTCGIIKSGMRPVLLGFSNGENVKCVYRGCGLAFTMVIVVKFGTAHGRSRLGVGGAKCIGSYGRKGVPPAPCNFGAS